MATNGIYTNSVTFSELNVPSNLSPCWIDVTPPNLFNDGILIEMNKFPFGNYDKILLTKEQWLELVEFVNANLEK